MEKGQSFLESVSWPNESLVAKHFRLERKHRITTITHGLANRCLTIRLSASDVSLSFQNASHSFSVLAPRDGVMTYLIIEVLRESNSSCGYYATVLPLHQSTIYREKGVRSPVCLRVSLVPIFYHTLTVYSLSRETVIQDPLVIGDCYLLEESR